METGTVWRARTAASAATRLCAERRLLRPGVLLISVEGEVDQVSLGVLQRACWTDLAPVTVLDLSGVTFFAAAGLRVLEGLAERARGERRRLRVVAAGRGVTRVIRLFELDTQVATYGTLSDALRTAG